MRSMVCFSLARPLILNAAYKINIHKVNFIDTVWTSNASSVKGDKLIQAFVVAAAFVDSETETI